MKVKNQKRIIYILLLVEILVAAVVFTAAWFASDFDPVIYSNKFEIASTDGITVKITDSDSALETLNLKEVVKDNNEYMILSQISSADSDSFFKQSITDENYEYTAVSDSKDYIEAGFLLLSDDDEAIKDVNIKSLRVNLIDGAGNVIPMSSERFNYIQDALRMSMVIEPDENDHVTGTIKKIFIFDNGGHRYDNNGYYDSNSNFFRHSNIILKNETGFNITANYCPGFNPATADLVLTTAVKTAGLSEETLVENRKDGRTYINCFKYQAVEYLSKYTGNNLGVSERTLFQIKPSEKRAITIKIWLEGADPRCDVNIAGSRIDFSLVFGTNNVV